MVAVSHYLIGGRTTMTTEKKIQMPGQGPITLRDGKVGLFTGGEQGEVRWFDAEELRSLAKQLDVSRQHAGTTTQ